MIPLIAVRIPLLIPSHTPNTADFIPSNALLTAFVTQRTGVIIVSFKPFHTEDAVDLIPSQMFESVDLMPFQMLLLVLLIIFQTVEIACLILLNTELAVETIEFHKLER
ncbi:Uncharacterised protein [Streptococcus pneumoniae]|nr:Uncharacterised protein [Streptococcus pneumoniae]